MVKGAHSTIVFQMYVMLSLDINSDEQSLVLSFKESKTRDNEKLHI